jgi:quercetin dioxygenase-like cupin family protein
MEGIGLRAGEGEPLFDGRIVVKSGLEQLSVTEAKSAGPRQGAGPHLHRWHADSFYVLEGEMAFLVHDREHVLGAGGFICAPPGVVHAFRTTSAARYLNFHTPDGGFTDYLRARDRDEPGDFDSIAAEPGSGLPPTDAVLFQTGQGERFESDTRIATIKVGRDEICVIELELEPTYEDPPPHTHDDHVDSFYVVEGEAEFQMGEETLLLGAGSFVAAPPDVVHAFSSSPGRSRLLNIHAPSAGFHEWMREINRPRS